MRVLPASFLVATDGRVRFGVVGELDWSTDEAVKTVRALLPARGTRATATERLAGFGER